MATKETATEATPLVAPFARDADANDDVALEKQLHALDDADRHAPTRQLLREETAQLLQLSFPITLALVLELLPLIVVAMMMGRAAGDNAPQVLAAASLSEFFQSQVFVNVTSGLSAAVATLCAQSFGARQPRQLWLFAQAGALASAYTAVPILLVSACGARILTLLGQDPELARLAGGLILVGLVSQLFYMGYAVVRSALQAQHVAAPFVLASLLSYAVSLPLGYALGYHTSLGYLGVALSIVVCSLVKLLVVVPVLLRNKLFVEFWPGWQWREAHALVRRLWKLGAASVLMATFQTAGFNVVALLCGYLPDAARVMTASSIASALISIAFMPMIALCAAGTVRVGNALGAGRARRAKLASVAVVLAMLAVAAVGVVFCWWFADSYARAYTSEPETVAATGALVRHLLPMLPLVAGVFAAQSICQACGAQWRCAQLNFLFLVALGVPCGLLFALPLGRGVVGLWDGQLLGGAAFVVAAALWLRRVDWIATAREAQRNAHLHATAKDEPEAAPHVL